MKKMVFGLFSVSFVLAVSSTNVSAQESGYARNVSTNDVAPTKVEGRTISRSELISSVQAEFTKKNKDASNVQWSTSGETITVNFVKDASKTRYTYDVKGNLEYSLRYLLGSKIPGSIINEVRRNNYFMQITQVIEVKRRNTVTHFVKMEDSHSYITLLLQNGEAQVYENLTKN